MGVIRETWYNGSKIQTFTYYSVPKRIVLLKCRDCDFHNFTFSTPLDDYTVLIKPVNAKADIFQAAASLHDIFALNFNGNFGKFSDFFRSFEVFVCPEFDSGNVLMVSKEKGVVIRIKGSCPDARIYSYEEFFRTTKRFEKTSEMFDLHNLSKLQNAVAAINSST